jgi:hypothetical protein
MPLSTIYFSYIVAFSFICWRKTEYWKKHVTSNGMTVSAVLQELKTVRTDKSDKIVYTLYYTV